MCMLIEEDRNKVLRAVKQFQKKGQPFTGMDVTQFLESKQYDTWHPSWNHRDVSSYVRELFNTGKMLGWASTNVTPDGPVLYFQITKSMKADKVRKEIIRKVAQRMGYHWGEGR